MHDTQTPNAVSLQNRITLGALLLIIIAATILLYGLHLKQRAQIQNNYDIALQYNIQRNATRLKLGIEQLSRDVQFINHLPATPGLLQSSLNHDVGQQTGLTSTIWKQNFQTIAIAFMKANPDYFQIRLIGVANNGLELARVEFKDGKGVATPDDELQAKSSRDYFQAAVQLKPGEIYLSDINFNQENGRIELPYRRTMRAATPIFSASGKLSGIVIINMDMGPLLDRMRERLPDVIQVYLTNTAGDFLVHPDPDRRFGFERGQRYRWQQQFPDLALPATLTTTFNPVQLLATPSGLVHVSNQQVHFDPLHPERFFLLFDTLPDTVIANEAAQLLGMSAAIIGASLLVVVVLVVWLVRRMFAPLGQLIAVTHNIAEGNYEISMPDYKIGDLGRLVSAFRHMHTQIQLREATILQLNASLEQRVQQRTSELTIANQELESFSYAVSHDLRAPLRAMSGFSQALMEDHGNQLQGDAKKYLNQIVLAAHKMVELIDGLLLLSRCTRGALRTDEIDISDMAQRLLADLATQSPLRSVSLHIEPGIKVCGDARMIESVMSNLLANAWKYTSNTPAPCIQVTEKQEQGEQFICVIDNGAGFDMSHAKRLFQPFQRLHRQEEFPGIGIGLATVQRIVHRQGGQIKAQAELGNGAQFCFSLTRNHATDQPLTGD